MDIEPFYQAITPLPRHVEERLLKFNIIQLCSLVSEKSGPRWTGASDRYGPIQEIARRWKPEEIFKRIEHMTPEPTLETYAKTIRALGGDPAQEIKTIDPRAGQPGWTKVREKIDAITRPIEKDVVRAGLESCENMDDLRRVADEQGLTIPWEKLETLPNFGLRRMYVGNQWRAKIRREQKEKK
jgi:hypothetical protein